MIITIIPFLLVFLPGKHCGDLEISERERQGIQMLEQIKGQRLTAGHPQFFDRNLELNASFPAYIYGKDSINLWIHWMSSLPPLLNCYLIVDGLLSGEIASTDLTNQLLDRDIDFDRISSFYKTKSIGGWDEQRAFEEIVGKRKNTKVYKDREEAVNLLKKLPHLQLQRESLKKITTSLDAFLHLFHDLQSLMKPKYGWEATWGLKNRLKNFRDFLSPLNDLAPSPTAISEENLQKLKKWFEDRTERNYETVEEVGAYYRNFFPERAKKEFALLHQDPFYLFKLATTIMKNESKSVRDFLSVGRLNNFEAALSDLEMIRDTNTTLGLSNWVRNVRDVIRSIQSSDTHSSRPSGNFLLGLPKREESIRESIKEQSNYWIKSVSGKGSIQFLHPLNKFLEYYVEFEFAMQKILNNTEKYHKNIEYIDKYLSEVNQIRENLPKDNLNSIVESFSECLKTFKSPEQLDAAHETISMYRSGFEELNKTLVHTAQPCITLRRCGDERILEAFKHQTDQNIVETLQKTL